MQTGPVPVAKTCKDCGQVLPISSFYRLNPNNLSTRCRKCHNKHAAQVLKLRLQNPIALRAYRISQRRMEKVRIKRLKGSLKYKARKRAKKLRYYSRYPEKEKAGRAVLNAIKSGKLTRQPCEVCGSTNNIHGHHDDYSKPLQVRWLCQIHHTEHHLKVMGMQPL